MAVTLAFLGDVMLGRGVSDQLCAKRPEQFWGDALPALRSADAVICNLECAITRSQRRWWRTPKVFYFRTDVAAIEVLRAGNIRCAALANNHILDFGEEGVFETLRYLDLADISHAGAGRNLAEAQRPAVFDVAGLRIGFISITDNEPPFAARDGEPGTNYMPISFGAQTIERVQRWVNECRLQNARFIVLSPHWGPNMRIAPPPQFVAFAHAAIDCGVDLIHGHSAHVFQGVEVYRDRLIIYDAGDFLDDYAVDHDLRNDWSFIFQAYIEDGRARALRMLPVRLTYAQVNLAQDDEASAINARMIARCEPFGTVPRACDGALELPLS